MKAQPETFTGVGTVLVSDVANIEQLTEDLSPEGLIETLSRYLTHVISIVEKHAGTILKYEGDIVLAFWHPKHSNPNHAQLAFDAACEILATLPAPVTAKRHLTYGVDIVLGTGEMAGDLFGPGKRFQVVGKSMAIVDRLSKADTLEGSSIRMSQYTVELLSATEGIEQAGEISRDGLDTLKVFTYHPANNGVHGRLASSPP